MTVLNHSRAQIILVESIFIGVIHDHCSGIASYSLNT
jgi:hypothetical protein